jgi:hypothetical protein
MVSLFKKIKEWWMPIAKKIGQFQTKVVLSILYFLIIGPISLIIYLFRRDLLKKRHRKKSSFWAKEPHQPLNTLEGCQRQF